MKLDNEKKELAKEWFLSQFGEVDEIALPTGDKKESTYQSSFKSIKLSFNSKEVNDFSNKIGVSKNIVAITAFGILLSAYTMNEKAAFATIYSGHNSLLPVLVKVKSKLSTIDYLKEMENQKNRVIENDAYSFADLVNDTGYNSSLIFSFDELANEKQDLKNDEILGIQLLSDNEGLTFNIHYDGNRYSEQWVIEFAKRYRKVLQNLIKKENIKDVGLLDETEVKSVLEISYGGDLDYNKDETVIDMFVSQAKKHPNKTAVVDKDSSYTYQELDDASNAIANYLLENGVKKGEFVAIKTPRIKEFVACAYGIQKAGAAYVPVDPDYPIDRIEYMIEDSRSKIVFDEKLAKEVIGKYKNRQAINLSDPDSRCYMIYTSGSTGKPKGAVVMHRGLRAMAAWQIHEFKIDENSKHALHPSFSFDASICDLYPPLLVGGETHILSEEVRLDLDLIFAYFKKHQITGTCMSTQIGMSLVNAHPDLGIRHMMIGGEKMLPCVKTPIKFYNGYGPTEFTVASSIHLVDQDKDQDIPIGRPVPNSWSIICDLNGNLLPLGMSGELCLVGVQIGEGYWNRKELSEERFCPCPALPSMKMYHTGDLAKYNKENELDFLGRMDTQVKLRGFRIELGEVENKAISFPNIEKVAAEVKNNNLVLYYSSKEKVDEDALKKHMAESLTEYMVPSIFVHLDEMPMTPGGKINRKALPEPSHDVLEIVTPRNKEEKELYEMLKDVLGYSEFGVTNDFLNIGLTSIGAMQLTARISAKYNVAIRAADLIDCPTIESLASHLSSLSKTVSYELQKDYPLTLSQQGVLTEVLAHPGTTIYNLPILIDLPKDSGVDQIKEVISKVINAHPYFKMRIVSNKDGQFRAERHDDDKLIIEVKELDKLEGGVQSLVKSFDVLNEPLYRLIILESKSGNKLFFDAHHLIFDGESLAVIINDINNAYAGKEIIKETYTEYEEALDEEVRHQSDAYEKAKQWYATLLDGRDIDCLPVNDHNDKNGHKETIKNKLTINKKLVDKFLNENKLTINALWTSSLGLALARYLDRQDSIFATVHNGRSDARLANSCGMFVHTYPVLSEPYKHETGADYVKAIANQTQKSMANDIYSFMEIAHDLGVRSDILFVYEGQLGQAIVGEENAVSHVEMLDLNQVKASLVIAISEVNDGYEFVTDFDGQKYQSWSVTSLIESTMMVFEALLNNEKPSSIKLVNKERKETIDKFNETEVEIERLDLVSQFRRNPKNKPNNTAVIFKDKKLTYQEIDEKTDRIAGYLAKKGIGKGDVVSVLVPRGELMVLCPLGVMKSGAAYQPLDCSYPEERLEFMIKDASASLIIADKDLMSHIPNNKVPVLFSEDIEKLEKIEKLPDGPSLDSLMILLYTSGTTGVPKGVMLSQFNLVNFCSWYRRYYKLDDKCVVAAYAGFGFDACMMDLYPALTTGSAICIVPEEMRMNLAQLEQYYEQNGVTHSFMTTQMGRLFAEQNRKSVLKHLSVGGEKLTPLNFVSEYPFYNAYGPTECTIFSTIQPVDKIYERVPIGKALDNYKLYVVDPFGNEAPIGAMGELWISGYGVGLGYLNQIEKTKATFVKNPFSNKEGFERAYRTGDIVRRLPNGSIDFIGRNDGQVKIRGFRIELGEVEMVIREFPNIKDATVQAFKDENNGGLYLAAYLVSDKKIDINKLKEFIKEQKPPYMVPAAIMQIDAIPLNQNQKVNKRALPKPIFKAEEKEYVAPENPLEKEFCDLFQDILGLEKVSATDSFFDIGGTSLTAARVVMYTMNEGYPIVYQDVFNHPSPRELAILLRDAKEHVSDETPKFDPADYDYGPINELIKYNSMEYIDQVKVGKIDDVVLMGATGFLGIHILKHFIDHEKGKIYCLIRSKGKISVEQRLKGLLTYYFGDPLEELFGKRIFCLEGDITDKESLEQIGKTGATLLINSAACVKHFVKDDLLDKMNYIGVKNLVDICLKYDIKLLQISTGSVAGEKENGTQFLLHENELFINQITTNDYVRTKFLAERHILQEIIDHKLKALIVRVGNLMSRASDGEFQINYVTNSFMGTLRSYVVVGKYPFDGMEYPAEFSPVDSTAASIIELAKVEGPFTIFQSFNSHLVTMADVIMALKRYGYKLDIVKHDEFVKAVDEASKDPEKAQSLLNLVAYNNRDGITLVGYDNRFTTNVLYRTGFMWPIIDNQYLDNLLEALDSLEFFDINK